MTIAEFIELSDRVLECAWGTGAISVCIAPKFKRLIATDFSISMIKQAMKSVGNVKMYRSGGQILQT